MGHGSCACIAQDTPKRLSISVSWATQIHLCGLRRGAVTKHCTLCHVLQGAAAAAAGSAEVPASPQPLCCQAVSNHRLAVGQHMRVFRSAGFALVLRVVFWQGLCVPVALVTGTEEENSQGLSPTCAVQDGQNYWLLLACHWEEEKGAAVRNNPFAGRDNAAAASCILGLCEIQTVDFKVHIGKKWLLCSLRLEQT